jgi:7,8-dihydropterin-6-yl-methyl-4-(beta-D-ribofuranosyl)aminobenzene 5'-phosphate synthase
MEIRVLFDKYTTAKNVHTGWGVAFLINGHILFDTGENGQWLIHNMETMGVSVEQIDTVVISHDHWDHTGGLWALLERKAEMTVYCCPGFSTKFKQKVERLGAKLVQAAAVTEIARNIFVSGEIAGAYKGTSIAEEALVICSAERSAIITGCAHPGIIKMIEKISGSFPKQRVSFVMGGFHLIQESTVGVMNIVEEFKQHGVERVAPTHCTGEDAERIFKSAYGKNFRKVVVGETVRIF